MKNFNAFTIFLLVLIPFLNSCCKKCQDPSNPDCENYDPCFRKLSADFKMEIEFDNEPTLRYQEVDTIMTGGVIKFTAKDSVDVEYQWVFGTDKDTIRKRTTEVEFPFATEVDVKLTVKHKGSCYPNSTDSVTLVRKLVVVDKRPRVNMLLGKYEGFNTSTPSEKFIVEFFYDEKTFPTIFIKNLPKGCIRERNTAIGTTTWFFYKYFMIGAVNNSSGNECPEVTGVGQFLSDQKSVTFDYYYYDYGKRTTIKDTFKGKKI